MGFWVSNFKVFVYSGIHFQNSSTDMGMNFQKIGINMDMNFDSWAVVPTQNWVK